MLSMDLKRFEDYKQEVILAYQKQKNERDLSPNVERSTPGKLRSECIDVFLERYDPKDNPTFRALLKTRGDAPDYLRSLESCDSEIFKTLDNFLKGKTSNTSELNIELLAFLIDFKPRPHRAVDMVKLVQAEKGLLKSQNEGLTIEKEHTKVDETVPVQQDNEDESSDDEQSAEALEITTIGSGPENTTSEPNFGFGIDAKFKKSLLAFFATLIVICVSYLIYNHTNHQCMYWKGDHYESIDCFEKIEGVTPIAYDEYTLEHQRKITNLGTITKADIAKVHYSKENGDVVFYTIGGDNPEDHRKRLLPMSENMYIKYVLKRKN
jgi:hypothetical protein